ncbi:uncharacterized protein LOC121653056 [Melanotaenia boesemani]|uniref:uncharacterized protein LOC121653056 n=1 Tax=Melanotaenia boesemani TaxID=1250792 RepID=UPI001C054F99|nr:uncharacterized protein LOC121653056 [Melanotaenia boesemani]
MSNIQSFEEASRRAANLIQDAVECLIPLVLEKKSSDSHVTSKQLMNVSAIPLNDHPLRMLNSQPSTSSLLGPHIVSAPPQLCTGQSREDMIQSRMSALFRPYPQKIGSKRNGLKRQYQTPWSHDFFCLSDPESDMSPSLEEYCTLQNMGLGRRKVTFPNNNGTHKDFVEGLFNAYPQLADAGGFKLMRCGRNRVLVDIAMPSSGYSVRYLRLESGLNKALAYIVPLQRKLVDIEECKPNDSVSVRNF